MPPLPLTHPRAILGGPYLGQAAGLPKGAGSTGFGADCGGSRRNRPLRGISHKQESLFREVTQVLPVFLGPKLKQLWSNLLLGLGIIKSHHVVKCSERQGTRRWSFCIQADPASRRTPETGPHSLGIGDQQLGSDGP